MHFRNARLFTDEHRRETSSLEIRFVDDRAMALQNVDILIAMEKDLGRKLKTVRVDGGAVENNLLMQLQADFLGVSVERPRNIESTALGAAFMAGLGCGFWSSKEEIEKVWS